MLETLDHTIRIGSTPTFLYFDLYLYSAYAAHYVYFYRVVCLDFVSEPLSVHFGYLSVLIVSFFHFHFGVCPTINFDICGFDCTLCTAFVFLFIVTFPLFSFLLHLLSFLSLHCFFFIFIFTFTSLLVNFHFTFIKPYLSDFSHWTMHFGWRFI